MTHMFCLGRYCALFVALVMLTAALGQHERMATPHAPRDMIPFIDENSNDADSYVGCLLENGAKAYVRSEPNAPTRDNIKAKCAKIEKALYDRVFRESFAEREDSDLIPDHRRDNTARSVIYELDKTFLRKMDFNHIAYEGKLPEYMGEYTLCLVDNGIKDYQYKPAGLVDIKTPCDAQENKLFWALFYNYMQNMELNRGQIYLKSIDAINDIDKMLAGL